ncbi:hypothetical protein C7H19_15180 [Aphanothece hegewaldii CCALA 016]|uniref:EF-hand domain-containing protein n=1 Tax=Aphanothece hegewaldii CCALA 016 TaxID=2107694 RepID=A0A2T1LVK9_9CHRO|nr:hypothetical protein [Aphanothece hegewaldii]PSF35766.1 hypothetical protein C7H19_15180 [Aphanothece hegewaldii CCALA 016]
MIPKKNEPVIDPQLNQDSDRDGVTDGDEKLRYSDPMRRDSDRDGVLDGEEIKDGTNPRGASSNSYTINAQREALRKQYFNEAKEVMGWQNCPDVNYDDLYNIVDGNGLIGVELDKLIVEHNLLNQVTKSAIAEKLTQSVILQRLIEDKEINSQQLEAYISEVYEDRMTFLQQKFAIKKEVKEKEINNEDRELEF